jgi:tRNA dimethylallyltransferase
MITRTLVICGPTAGGKSGLAVELALEVCARLGCSAEVVAADAFQVYEGLDIGTAKPTMDERRGVPHSMIDVVEPGTGALCGVAAWERVRAAGYKPFTVDRWLEMAEARIAAVRGGGGVPIVVGGTHLYVKALLEGLFDGPGADAALRAELMAMEPGVRRAELERVDIAAAARIHPNDVRRTVRALEVFRLTGRPMSEMQTQWSAGEAGSEEGREERSAGFQLVGLDWPSEMINPRINARVRQMVSRGLVEEVRALEESGRLGPQAREALGYKQVLEHLAGRCTMSDAIEQIKIQTRRFAKNQRTWLNKLRLTRGSVWIDAATSPPGEWAERVLAASGV